MTFLVPLVLFVGLLLLVAAIYEHLDPPPPHEGS